jgi:hypothetical protein
MPENHRLPLSTDDFERNFHKTSLLDNRAWLRLFGALAAQWSVFHDYLRNNCLLDKNRHTHYCHPVNAAVGRVVEENMAHGSKNHRQRSSFRMESLSKTKRSEFIDLKQLPNVGPATAGYLRLAGVSRPEHLTGCDPYAVFEKLCRTTGRRFDPCLLDQFIAAVRFMDGEPARPWWEFTAERKAEMKARSTKRRDEQ